MSGHGEDPDRVINIHTDKPVSLELPSWPKGWKAVEFGFLLGLGLTGGCGAALMAGTAFQSFVRWMA